MKANNLIVGYHAKIKNGQSAIYALKEEGSNSVYYVGRTIDIQGRAKSHIRSAKRKEKNNKFLSPKDKWILSVISKNKNVIVEILEICKREKERSREIYWTKKLLNQGEPLTNMYLGDSCQVINKDHQEKIIESGTLSKRQIDKLRHVFLGKPFVAADVARLTGMNYQDVLEKLKNGEINGNYVDSSRRWFLNKEEVIRVGKLNNVIITDEKIVRYRAKRSRKKLI